MLAGLADAAVAQVKSTPPGTVGNRQKQGVAAALADGLQAYRDGDCARAAALLRPQVGEMAQLRANRESAIGEAAAWLALARCAAAKQEWKQAAADVRQGTSLPNADIALWLTRMEIDSRQRDWAGLVETIEIVGRDRLDVLNRTPIEYLWNVDTELKRLKLTPLRARYLAVLASGAFKPVEFRASTQRFRGDFAIHLAATGRLPEAQALATGLTNPWSVMRVSLDPNLRGLFPADPDIRTLVEKELATDRALMAAHPGRLEAVIAVASHLKTLGRPQEALAVLQSVETRIDDPEAFVDRAKNLPWWWDELSKVYEMLGRDDDALDAMKKGGGLAEKGGANVSQVINLAHAQVGMGRHKDALATLAVFDKPGHDVSPYGQIAMREARACAHALSGDRRAAQGDIDYIRAHQADAPGSIGSVLRCTGDLDAAAAALIARLDDPEQRAAALLGLSRYDDPPVKLPDRPLEKIEASLKARADVRAAIERAGGTRRFNIQSS